MLTKASLPNMLCALRIFAIVPLVAVWLTLSHHISYPWIAGIFAIAAFTDCLDGELARRWQVQSPLGAMLDQIADKLLMVSILVILASDSIIAPTLALLLILREIWVSGVREYVGGMQKTLPVSGLGKWKTALQMLGVSGVLLATAVQEAISNPSPLWENLLAYASYSLWAAAFVAWLSAWQYSRVLWR
jgi:cardiolipin synthase